MLGPTSSYGGGALGGFGALGQVIADSATIQQRMQTLTEQAASGRVATTYAGLGSGAATALSLAPARAHIDAWSSTINTATGQMGVAQNALSQISTIASNFYAQTNTLNGLTPSTVDSVAANARAALAQVASLLDTTDGGTYVFAGQDSANPPIPAPDAIGASGFATQIATAVSGLAANGGPATIAATLAIASSNAPGTSPFSAALSQPAAAANALRGGVPTGPSGSVPSGIIASSNGDVASTGGSTTGSYTRDILRTLATLGALSSSQVGASGFSALVSDAHTALGGAITALNADAGVMGDRQTALTATQASLAAAGTVLDGQISAVQDANMTTTLSQLSQVETQLQGSYQIISNLGTLSLVKFLPAGA